MSCILARTRTRAPLGSRHKELRAPVRQLGQANLLGRPAAALPPQRIFFSVLGAFGAFMFALTSNRRRLSRQAKESSQRPASGVWLSTPSSSRSAPRKPSARRHPGPSGRVLPNLHIPQRIVTNPSCPSWFLLLFCPFVSDDLSQRTCF